MKSTQDFLDALAARAGSDRKAALLVGVSQPVLSEWRTRKKYPSDERAVQIAELLNLDAAYVIAVIQSERAKSEAVRATWGRIAEAFGRAAMLALVAAAPFAVAPEARAGTLHSPFSATGGAEHKWHNRRRSWVSALS